VITTPELIDRLVASARPVQRLRPPLARASVWLLLAFTVMALLAVSHGFRPDIVGRLQQPVFVTSVAASLVTGVLAAIASFIVSLPDRSRFWLLLPAPALLVWVSTIGYGCLTDWVSVQPGGVRLGETARCFATLLLTSVPLSLSLLFMLRYAALLRPTLVATTGSLAVAAMASAALSLFHDLDATVMVLIWNLGVAALFVTLGAALGKRTFSWVALK
jgi:hypothetical protein